MTYAARLPLFLVLMISPLLICASEDGIDMKVISVYQIEDEEGASFDFFTSAKAFKCGGKPSNRFRSYSDSPDIAERRFNMILSAMNHGYLIRIKPVNCEHNAIIVDYIGIARAPSPEQERTGPPSPPQNQTEEPEQSTGVGTYP